MSDRMLVATRKGLLILERHGSGWAIRPNRLRRSTGDGGVERCRRHLYAALKHGHFGPKLHRSDDDGRTGGSCRARLSGRCAR